MEIFIFKPSISSKMSAGLPNSDVIVVVEPEETKHGQKTIPKNAVEVINLDEDTAPESCGDDDKDPNKSLKATNKNDLPPDGGRNTSQTNTKAPENNSDKSTNNSTETTAVDTTDLVKVSSENNNNKTTNKETAAVESTDLDRASENNNDSDKDTNQARNVITLQSENNNDSKTPTTASETTILPEKVTPDNSANGNTDTSNTEKVKTTDLNEKPASENNNNANKNTTPIPVETIDLDEEIVPKSTNAGNKNTSSAPIDLDSEEAPRIRNANDKNSSNMAIDTIDLEDTSVTKNNTDKNDADRENSFAKLLKNNTLMNKIVNNCLNLEHNAGIQRVINKTLLPLYKDADNSFKESESFTYILKKILHNLKHDPNRKFLHLKSLCDELHAGKFKRKVPFVTLTTDLGRRKSPRKKNRTERFQGFIETRKKKNDKHTVLNGKTDIIDLDISDDEPIIAINDDESSDDDVVMVSGNYEIHAKTSKSKNRNTKQIRVTRKFKRIMNNAYKKTIVKFNKEIGKNNSSTSGPKADESNIIEIDNNELQGRSGHNTKHIENKGSSSDKSDKESNNESDKESNKESDKKSNNESDNKSNDASDDSDRESEQSDKATSDKTYNGASDTDKKSDSGSEKASSKEKNTDSDESSPENDENCNETAEKSNNESGEDDNACTIIDSDSASNDGNTESNKENSSHSKASTVNADLLVPHNSVTYGQYSNKYTKAFTIEKRIQVCKKKIKQLEEREVINDFDSPYILCDRYKAEIVKLYKRLCTITGHGDGNLHRQRAVRLHVVEGHPPGPVKRLEEYLNSTIDETGAIPLPDFHDVVNCVGLANLEDALGWTKQRIMKEAIALFTHCGHALRKQRQKREYKDLLCLVKDEQLDECDPAEQDPQLFAKLQENQLIAKANEDEVMDRFARMEGTSIDSNWHNPTGPTRNNSVKARIENGSSSDSDSDSEVDETPRKRIKTNIIHTNFSNRESSDKLNGPTRATNESTPKKPIQSSSNINSPTVENLKVHDEMNEISDRINTNQNSVQRTLDRIVRNWKAPTSTSQPLCIANVSSLTYNTLTHTARNNLISEPSNISSNINSQQTHSTANNRIDSITNTVLNNTQLLNTANSLPNSTATQNASSTSDVVAGPSYIQWNTLQRIGQSNTYVIAINCNTQPSTSSNAGFQVEENNINIVNRQNKDVGVRLENPTTDQPMVRISDNLASTAAELANKDIEIKTEIEEETPEIDIQKLLDELGDNYIKTVFDIEDPFVVIDLSSDSSSDDDH